MILTGANAARCGETALALCDYAAEVLKRAGFEWRYTSMRSEACYYGLPGRVGAIRIAAHRFGRTEARLFGMPVLACITFGEHYCPKSFESVDNYIAQSVGRYVLANRIDLRDPPDLRQPQEHRGTPAPPRQPLRAQDEASPDAASVSKATSAG